MGGIPLKEKGGSTRPEPLGIRNRSTPILIRLQTDAQKNTTVPTQMARLESEIQPQLVKFQELTPFPFPIYRALGSGLVRMDFTVTTAPEPGKTVMGFLI